MSHSQQPAPFGQQPLLYTFPYVSSPSVPPPSAQPPKSRHSALRIAVGMACALLVVGLGAAVGNDGNGTKKPRTKPAPTVTGTITARTAETNKTAETATTAKAEWEKPKSAAKAAEKAPVPAGPAAVVGQGSYLVGDGIAAGTYRTAGPDPSDAPLCSCARAKGVGSGPDSIIAQGTSRGPARVTIHQGETFETHGCREWTQVR
ncbi:hypothetical protein ABR737_09385 [Streptomyces sp. Edi2]|uniref:hypothetical protein n=1 Tax=Streptomyces sp. Edi2 TaxID=3162528 RepID=UPI0033058613